MRGGPKGLATNHQKLGADAAPYVCRVWSEKTLAYLLRLEKERRGIPPSRRCFVGISDLARYDARIEEIAYFSAYLSGRSEYASRLGLISRRPRLQTDWLPIAGQVSFEDRERLFLEEEQEVLPAPFIFLIDTAGREHPADQKTIADYLARRFEVVGMVFSSKPHKPVKASERRNRSLLASGYLRPLTAAERGDLDEQLLGERYPKFRWHFDWGDYVVVGVPDGITDRFVYEFKSTKELKRTRAVAERQADLYGYFFRRKYKRIQIRDVLGGKVLTFSSAIDRANAERTLGHYAAVLNGRREGASGWGL